jgi:hypothetical protein
VFFNGKSFTKVKGSAHEQVAQAEVLKLVGEFKDADFFSLKDQYGECEDTPSMVLTLVQKGRTKSVSYGMPCAGTPDKTEESIEKLAREIDSVTRSDRWVTENPEE